MARVSQVEKANQEGRLGGGGGGEGQHLVGCQRGRGPVQEAGSCQGQELGGQCVFGGRGGVVFVDPCSVPHGWCGAAE